MLLIKDLTISYQKKMVVTDFSLQMQSGEILAMLGESGSGKTSILKAIAGLVPITQGAIVLDSKILSNHQRHIAPEYRHIGMVFQDYALFPHLTIAKNIGFGLYTLDKKQRDMRIDNLLTLVGLPDTKTCYPHELSGGQQQRIALVRSLANRPKVLLLDEPFSNLDDGHKKPLIKQVRHILKQEKMTTIFVTHNQSEAEMLCDRNISLIN